MMLKLKVGSTTPGSKLVEISYHGEPWVGSVNSKTSMPRLRALCVLYMAYGIMVVDIV